MPLIQKLGLIQSKLKAPKDKDNKFGGYKYRSAESILEAVKPILVEHDCTLLMSDKVIHVGDRYYVEATVTLKDADDTITVTASAREEEVKKGMDGAQITGSASSYARKYALNGLFAIDDTKDPDTEEQRKERDARFEAEHQIENPRKKISSTDAQVLKTMLEETNSDVARFLGYIERESGYRAESVDDLTREQYIIASDALEKKRNR